MKAKRKPLDTFALEELGVSSAADLEVTRYAAPPQRQKGIRVENAAQLVQELKSRGLL
jgi:electron transfer flavoprotein beta subunit